MASRNRMMVAPVDRFQRAAWLEETLPKHLSHVALERGWEGLAELESRIFPKLAKDFLGGPLDPTCPSCGVETDEGTVAGNGDTFRVDYGCHVFQMTEEQLRSRVRHASQP